MAKHTLALLLYVGSHAQSWAQQIYINQVAGYSDLDTICAMPALSTVVRDMSSGCGASTSFSCFCTASSARFDAIISTAVLSKCPGATDNANSATAVFDAYCAFGATRVVSTSASSATSTSPSPTTMITSAAATSTSTANSSAVATEHSGLSRKSRTIIAVVVTIIGLLLVGVIVGFVLWHRRRKALSQAGGSASFDSLYSGSGAGPAPTSYPPRPYTVEMPSPTHDSTTKAPMQQVTPNSHAHLNINSIVSPLTATHVSSHNNFQRSYDTENKAANVTVREKNPGTAAELSSRSRSSKFAELEENTTAHHVEAKHNGHRSDNDANELDGQDERNSMTDRTLVSEKEIKD